MKMEESGCSEMCIKLHELNLRKTNIFPATAMKQWVPVTDIPMDK
jgi:hypothetical protein